MRTRTAANRAFSRPFVPLRQLTVLHLAPASMSSAGIDRMSGTCRLRGRPRTLVIGRGPGKLASREPLAEWRAHSVTGIRQYTTEADTGCDHAIDLRQGDLRLRPCRSIFDWNAGPPQTDRIARPILGKKKPQGHHHRHFAARQRQ